MHLNLWKQTLVYQFMKQYSITLNWRKIKWLVFSLISQIEKYLVLWTCTLDKIIQHALFCHKVIQYRVSTEYECLIVKFERLYDRNKPSTAKFNTHTHNFLCMYVFVYIYIYEFKEIYFLLVMALQINEYKQISRIALWLNYNDFN